MSLRSAAAAAKKAHPLARSWALLCKAVVENWHLKLLSLAVAFALFAVSRQPDHEVLLANVPLEFIHLAPGLEISGEPPAAVNVRLRGPRDLVQGLTANQLAVQADLINKTAGERVIQLKAADVQKPEKVEVRRLDPPTVELKLELTKRKTVPVEPQFIGSVGHGYEYFVTGLEPSVVEIEGPESKVEQVDKVLTESVRITGRHESFQLQVDLETSRQGVRLTKLAPAHLTVEVRIKKNIE